MASTSAIATNSVKEQKGSYHKEQKGSYHKEQKGSYHKEQKGSYHRCSFIGCGLTRRKNPHLHFFRFPTSRPNVLEQWLVNCGNEDLIALSDKTLYSRKVCEKHFTIESFTNLTKNYLKKDAVPTLLCIGNYEQQELHDPSPQELSLPSIENYTIVSQQSPSIIDTQIQPQTSPSPASPTTPNTPQYKRFKSVKNRTPTPRKQFLTPVKRRLLLKLKSSEKKTKKFQARVRCMKNKKHTLSKQEEILALKGTKCQAPYSHHWQRADTSSSSDSQGYHNALIIDVETPKVAEDLSLIQVRVLFVNPTEKQMCPCPFYLEGKCKFSDEKCNYSHGEIVPFSDIREYKEPDFSLVREGAPILAKQKDSLWHRARVKQIVDDSKVRVQFETNSHNTVEMDLHDVLPLCGVAGSDNSSSDSDSDSDDSNNTEVEAPAQEDVFMRMTTTAPSTKLGEWEKHTKGIGSRLMANMGYVVGCGLGKRGEGRIEPVEATAYPPGKSLDMCMALREAAGGDPDMFKAEKRQRKQQQKLLQLQKKLKEREEFRTDVFTFLNDKLAGKTDAKPKASHQILASSSSKGLAVERFQLAENIKKKQKDIGKLKESLKRHESGSLAHKAITNKIKEAQSDLGVLQNNDTMIAREQGQRDNRKKMAVF